MGLLQELHAAFRLLAAARASQSAEMLEAMTKKQVSRLAAIASKADLSDEVGIAAFLEALETSPFAVEQRKELADAALSQQAVPLQDTRGSASKTCRMQSCAAFQNYLTEENWVALRSSMHSMEHKILIMVRRCCEVGLETPTETTHVHVLAVALALDGTPGFNADVALRWLEVQKQSLKNIEPP